MNTLQWLDFSLMAIGFLAMSPGLWYTFCLRRIDCRSALGRGVRTATILVSYLGLGLVSAAGVDAGITEWKQFCRHGEYVEDEPNIHVSMTAPDFILPALDEERTVRLRAFRGQKPVVLIFGNFY